MLYFRQTITHDNINILEAPMMCYTSRWLVSLQVRSPGRRSQGGVSGHWPVPGVRVAAVWAVPVCLWVQRALLNCHSQSRLLLPVRDLPGQLPEGTKRHEVHMTRGVKTRACSSLCVAVCLWKAIHITFPQYENQTIQINYVIRRWCLICTNKSFAPHINIFSDSKLW